MNKELIEALGEIEKEKGVSKETILDALEAALISGYKKNFGTAQNVDVRIDRETGKVSVFSKKIVTEFKDDEIFEISMRELIDLIEKEKVFVSKESISSDLDEDLGDIIAEKELIEVKLDDEGKLNIEIEDGDEVYIEITPRDYGRIAAQTSKQVVTQKIKEAEREIIYGDFMEKEQEILTGVVERTSPTNLLINLGKLEGNLPISEQIQGESFEQGDRIKVFVVEVKRTSKGPQILLSRTNPGLVKRLFELEVPEIQEGIVEIFNTSREAGSRTKIAVYSNDEGVDPVGACVGFKGNRVKAVVDELGGEKIDIIVWDEDPRVFIKNSLSPAKVLYVEVDENEKSALVVVPNYQLSLAIGKEGQNARLAAKLTGWKIDIKDKTQYLDEGGDLEKVGENLADNIDDSSILEG
ncbi:MAG: transcription termination factor NusA [Andreesenia angusta]|nr:transcription termination factor NusA [Andreesenia angusta]